MFFILRARARRANELRKSFWYRRKSWRSLLRFDETVRGPPMESYSIRFAALFVFARIFRFILFSEKSHSNDLSDLACRCCWKLPFHRNIFRGSGERGGEEELRKQIYSLLPFARGPCTVPPTRTQIIPFLFGKICRISGCPTILIRDVLQHSHTVTIIK